MTVASDKERRLQDIIKDLAKNKTAVVAFSGGVDSSLLLMETVKALGYERVIAVTASSPTSILDELSEAEEFAATLGAGLVIVETQECNEPEFIRNGPRRCYHCKRIRYEAIRQLFGKDTDAVFFDGTQGDDDPLDRPGFAALAELGIHTPLRDAGLTKKDVRLLLKKAGFDKLAVKTAQPCLATRIPQGAPITLDTLDRIRLGESLLKKLGFEQFRLRTHGTWARIVLDTEGFKKISSDQRMRRLICKEFKKIGYEKVTLDLEEYGSGA
ncbi:MAG: ATP-dependent sacrificial sulfur transferase LarE [Deltaproteobacteria bacterium]|nr:ATP-dependent sacrificial sulfur transferase LarE [Deltaproteobacteria bacterium]